MYDHNALAIILLCSHLGNEDKEYKPYTAIQWSKLAMRIHRSELNGPSDLMNLSKEDVVKRLGVDSSEALRIVELLSRGINMALKLEELENRGIYVLTRSDGDYPARLKKRLGKHAPPLFYYSGDLKLLKIKSLAIVGSRNVSDEDQAIARDVAGKVTEMRMSVVSGGARGVDVISEEMALKCGGVVVSFVADSLEKKIQNRDIRNQIISGQKLLLTAQNPNLGFSAGYAMNRNKFIYALSSGGVVISADYNKGGTWAGAIENIKNQWVPLSVLDNNKDGNNELKRLGCMAFSNVQELDIGSIINNKAVDYKQMDLFPQRVSEGIGEYDQ